MANPNPVSPPRGEDSKIPFFYHLYEHSAKTRQRHHLRLPESWHTQVWPQEEWQGFCARQRQRFPIEHTVQVCASCFLLLRRLFPSLLWVSIQMSSGEKKGMIPFIGHRLLFPWSLKVHVFHMWNLLWAPPINQEPRPPQSLLQQFPWQPGPSPRAHQTSVRQGSPAGVSAPSLLLKTKRPLQRLSLWQKCQPKCHHVVFIKHLKAEMLLQHGSYPIERNFVTIPIVPVGNPEQEKAKDYPGGSLLLLIFF